jgi:hypothetical protein
VKCCLSVNNYRQQAEDGENMWAYSFSPQSMLRQAHNPCQSEFPTQCDLMLPL